MRRCLGPPWHAPLVPLAAPAVLDAATTAGFWRDGFLRLPVQLAPDELRLLRERTDAVLADRRTSGVDHRLLGGRIRQVVHLTRHHPGFFPPPLRERFRALSEQLLGEPCVPTFDMLIVKEPGDEAVTPWHQDWSYAAHPFAPAGTPIPNRKLQFWLALDDVDEDNGCMQFLPGRHQGLLEEHVVAAGDPQDDGRLLALATCDGVGAVSCPLPAGACTVHVEGTPHMAGGNRTRDRRRRAYIFNFEPTPATTPMASPGR